MKVAVGSTDGKVINTHFGKTTQFHLFELDKAQYHYLEARAVEACCQCGTHDVCRFDQIAEALADCEGIIVAKIGDGACAYMEEKGFTVFEAPYPIQDVLNKIITEYL